MKKLSNTTVFAALTTVLLAGCTAAETDDAAEASDAVEASDTAGDESADASGEEEVAAEAVEPVAFEIDAITCWDLTTTEEDEQAYAATLIYGYAAGAAGASSQTSDGIEAAIGTAFEYCAENPDATAVSAFSQDEG